MKAELTADLRAALTPQSPQPRPSSANEQNVRRFKALVEREPEAAEPKPAAFEAQPAPKRRSELSEQGGGGAFGEKARPLAAPAPQAPPPASDASDRIAELQKAADLSLGLDRAHARPTATQVLLPGEAAIAGGTIAQGAAPGALDIALHPGSHLLTADSLDTLRRRLAARGLTVGQLRLVRPEEDQDAGRADP